MQTTTHPTTTVPPMPLPEARRLVDEAAARLERVRSRAAQLSIRAAATLSSVTTHDRHLALALVDGDEEAVRRLQDDGERVAGAVVAMTPAEAKRALLALRSLEAEAVTELGEARLALRRAVVEAVRAELGAQVAQYDQAARDLQSAWARVTVVFELMAGLTTRSPAPPRWHDLAVPRADDDRSALHRLTYPATGDLLAGVTYQGAREAVLAGLAERGVERADVGR